MIDIPVASIRAGTIRKPPPMPKKPANVPVASPRPTTAGVLAQLIRASATPIRDRVFRISAARTSIRRQNHAGIFWPSTVLPAIDPANAPATPAAANTSAHDQRTLPPRAWFDRFIAALAAAASAL